jgi:hypothetical protein
MTKKVQDTASQIPRDAAQRRYCTFCEAIIPEFSEQGPVKVGGFRAFFAEWHRFAPICPTADASRTFGMRRENSIFK